MRCTVIFDLNKAASTEDSVFMATVAGYFKSLCATPQSNVLLPVLCSSTLRELRLLHVQPLQVFWLSGLPSYILDLVNILPMSSSASSISRSRTLAHPIAVLQLMQKLITLLTGLCNRIAQHHHVRIYLFTTDWRCFEKDTISGGGKDFERTLFIRG